jgi:membrane-anchored protein YejM (alkaline phosphatase superfamily)
MSNAKRHLLLRFIGWYFGVNALIFWVIGFVYFKNILLSDSLFKTTLADYSSIIGKIFVLFYWLVTYFSYMTFLAYIPALFLALIIYLLPNNRLIYSLSVATATCNLSLLLTDSRVYSMFNFHLNETILSLLFDTRWSDIFGFSTLELTLFTLLLGFIICLEIGIAWYLVKKTTKMNYLQLKTNIAMLWVGGMLFSYLTLTLSMAEHNNILTQQISNLPLLNQFVSYSVPAGEAQERLLESTETHFVQRQFSNEKMHYPLNQLLCEKPKEPLNLIFIMIDSLRFDSLRQAHMPNVTEFGRKNWQFLKQISGGNATQPGLFSLFYSIPSNYWTAALKQKISPALMQLLVTYGYSTGIFWSSALNNPPFDKTIFVNLMKQNAFRSSKKNNIGDMDREVTKEALQFLARQNNNTPFFLNIFYDSVHSYCREQNFSTPKHPVSGPCSRLLLNNSSSKFIYVNRYLNAVHFVDTEIATLLKSIEELGFLTNSVIIITSDHGEELNDNNKNYWGHASNLSAAQTHIPLIIHWPFDGPRTIDYTTTSYDVIPTLMKRLFSCQNPVIDYSIGHDLLQKEGRLPLVMVGSYSNIGFIEPDRLTTLLASGGITVTDTQLTPQPNAKTRKSKLKKALEFMRLYYATSQSAPTMPQTRLK